MAGPTLSPLVASLPVCPLGAATHRLVIETPFQLGERIVYKPVLYPAGNLGFAEDVVLPSTVGNPTDLGLREFALSLAGKPAEADRFAFMCRGENAGIYLGAQPHIGPSLQALFDCREPPIRLGKKALPPLHTPDDNVVPMSAAAKYYLAALNEGGCFAEGAPWITVDDTVLSEVIRQVTADLAAIDDPKAHGYREPFPSEFVDDARLLQGALLLLQQEFPRAEKEKGLSFARFQIAATVVSILVSLLFVVALLKEQMAKAWNHVFGKSPLEKYSRDLIQEAREGRLKPVDLSSRTREIELLKLGIESDLENPLITGEKGAGKTALMEGFAQGIVNGTYPEFADVKLYALSAKDFIGGTMYRGTLEDKLIAIFKEVETRRARGERIFLVVDEIHMLPKLGATEGSPGVGEYLKEPLGRGRLRMIGMTTTQEAKEHIESNEALADRFRLKIELPNPTPEESVGILRTHFSEMAAAKAAFPAMAAEERMFEFILKLAETYEPQKSLLRKALSLLDLAVLKQRSLAKQANDVAIARTLTPESILRVYASIVNQDYETLLRKWERDWRQTASQSKPGGKGGSTPANAAPAALPPPASPPPPPASQARTSETAQHYAAEITTEAQSLLENRPGTTERLLGIGRALIAQGSPLVDPAAGDFVIADQVRTLARQWDGLSELEKIGFAEEALTARQTAATLPFPARFLETLRERMEGLRARSAGSAESLREREARTRAIRERAARGGRP